MKTHNRIIYHCLLCGNVVHADPELRPPECCRYVMVKAAAETIYDADISDEASLREFEMASTAACVSAKPR